LMPKSRSHPVAASRRPGAWPKCYGAGWRPAHR